MFKIGDRIIAISGRKGTVTRVRVHRFPYTIIWDGHNIETSGYDTSDLTKIKEKSKKRPGHSLTNIFK
jgi:preprotein translocase subunit YajC